MALIIAHTVNVNAPFGWCSVDSKIYGFAEVDAEWHCKSLDCSITATVDIPFTAWGARFGVLIHNQFWRRFCNDCNATDYKCKLVKDHLDPAATVSLSFLLWFLLRKVGESRSSYEVINPTKSATSIIFEVWSKIIERPISTWILLHQHGAAPSIWDRIISNFLFQEAILRSLDPWFGNWSRQSLFTPPSGKLNLQQANIAVAGGYNYFHVHFIGIFPIDFVRVLLIGRGVHMDSPFGFDHFVVQQGRSRIHLEFQRVLDQNSVCCCLFNIVFHPLPLRWAVRNQWKNSKIFRVCCVLSRVYTRAFDNGQCRRNGCHSEIEV